MRPIQTYGAGGGGVTVQHDWLLLKDYDMKKHMFISYRQLHYRNVVHLADFVAYEASLCTFVNFSDTTETWCNTRSETTCLLNSWLIPWRQNQKCSSPCSQELATGPILSQLNPPPS
jgi:hypothetical protein